MEFEQIVSQILQFQFCNRDRMDFALKFGQLEFLGVPPARILSSSIDPQLYWASHSEMGPIMSNLSAFDSIPVKHNNNAYKVNIHVILNAKGFIPIAGHVLRDCGFVRQIKSDHVKTVITPKKPPCHFMVRYNRLCNILRTINENFNEKKKQDIILKHLEKYDHFEHFGKKRLLCPFTTNDKCIHFQRILNNNHKFEFTDKKHLYMYYHKSSNHHIATNCQVIGDREIPIFEYLLLDNAHMERLSAIVGARSTLNTKISEFMNKNYHLVLLIGEVICNGFEKDLIPDDEQKDGMQLGGMEFIEQIIERYNNDSNTNKNLRQIHDELRAHYGIFKILDEKMNHERHKAADCILCEAEMLSLILYCDGQCNYDLSICQRDGTFSQKWPTFDALLNDAIMHLSAYEAHHENIYTGLSGVLLDIYQLYKQWMFTGAISNPVLFFKSNVSFTRDLNVAYQFRGAEGIILGINPKQLSEDAVHGHDDIFLCDVSWISKFPFEQEVLFSRYQPFTIYPSKSMQIGKKQWFVCNLGYDDKTFERLFLQNGQQLV